MVLVRETDFLRDERIVLTLNGLNPRIILFGNAIEELYHSWYIQRVFDRSEEIKSQDNIENQILGFFEMNYIDYSCGMMFYNPAAEIYLFNDGKTGASSKFEYYDQFCEEIKGWQGLF